GHAFITQQGGAACGITAKPYVSNCNYDQAKAILAWIYGPLQDAAPEPRGQFIVFDQQTFARPGDGFADEGAVYVPPACAAQRGCRVHIALHGCEQSREAVGDEFIKESGYAQVADTNRFIILFPQTKASAINPQGCWDWWGYTDLDYLGKDAPQIAAISAMVEQLEKSPWGSFGKRNRHRHHRGRAWLGPLPPVCAPARGGAAQAAWLDRHQREARR